MIPTKPYLVRAIRESAIDNGFTPQILVDAASHDVNVPRAYVKDGQIVFNIDDRAVHTLEITNERVSFSARFGGSALAVEIPIGSIVAIFARENGQGIFFQQNDVPKPDPNGEGKDPSEPKQRSAERPYLKLV